MPTNSFTQQIFNANPEGYNQYSGKGGHHVLPRSRSDSEAAILREARALGASLTHYQRPQDSYLMEAEGGVGRSTKYQGISYSDLIEGHSFQLQMENSMFETRNSLEALFGGAVRLFKIMGFIILILTIIALIGWLR